MVVDKGMEKPLNKLIAPPVTISWVAERNNSKVIITLWIKIWKANFNPVGLSTEIKTIFL